MDIIATIIFVLVSGTLTIHGICRIADEGL